MAIAKFRLALRREGQWWNAYMAMIGTMEGAELLGTIRMSIVESSEQRKAEFMTLMQESFSDLVEAATGVRPGWPAPAYPAPEHERAGRG